MRLRSSTLASAIDTVRARGRICARRRVGSPSRRRAAAPTGSVTSATAFTRVRAYRVTSRPQCIGIEGPRGKVTLSLSSISDAAISTGMAFAVVAQRRFGGYVRRRGGDTQGRAGSSLRMPRRRWPRSTWRSSARALIAGVQWRPNISERVASPKSWTEIHPIDPAGLLSAIWALTVGGDRLRRGDAHCSTPRRRPRLQGLDGLGARSRPPRRLRHRRVVPQPHRRDWPTVRRQRRPSHREAAPRLRAGCLELEKTWFNATCVQRSAGLTGCCGWIAPPVASSGCWCSSCATNFLAGMACHPGSS